MAKQTFCKTCGNNVAFNHTVMAGRYYWIKHISSVPEQWTPCYVGEDPDENLWVHFIDNPPMKVADMGEDSWQFKDLYPPD